MTEEQAMSENVRADFRMISTRRSLEFSDDTRVDQEHVWIYINGDPYLYFGEPVSAAHIERFPLEYQKFKDAINATALDRAKPAI